MMCVCVLAALVGKRIRQSQVEVDAAITLSRMGAAITFSDGFKTSPGHVFAPRGLSASYVTGVTFSFRPWKSVSLQDRIVCLKQLKQLKHLTLLGEPIGDDELGQIAELQSLETIGIELVSLSESGIDAIARLPNLQAVMDFHRSSHTRVIEFRRRLPHIEYVCTTY